MPNLSCVRPSIAGVGQFRFIQVQMPVACWGVVSFILVLLLLDLLIRLQCDRWQRHSPDDYAARVDGCAREARQFVVIGGSPVSEGLDPEVMAGFRWQGEKLVNGYAVGLPGGTTTDFYHAARLACPTPPRLLIYGITASDLNDRRNEPHGVYSLLSWRDLLRLMTIRPDAAEWTARHFLQSRLGDCWAAFRYRHGIRMWAALEADRIWPGCCPEASGQARELAEYSRRLQCGRGYAPAAGFEYRRYDRVKAENLEQPPFGFLDDYRTGSHWKYLDALMAWTEAEGIDLVLVDMPVTADLESRYASAMNEYSRRLQQWEREHGVRILRAERNQVGLGDEQFADLIHLNRDGARRLSAWLRQQLDSVPEHALPRILAEGRRE